MKRMLLSMLCGFCAACLLAACAPAPTLQPTPSPPAATPSPTAPGKYLTNAQLTQALAELELPAQPAPPQSGTKYYVSDIYPEQDQAPVKVPSGSLTRRGIDRLAKRLEEPFDGELPELLADFGLKGGGAENIGSPRQADPNDWEEKVYTEIVEYEGGILQLNRIFNGSVYDHTPYYGIHLLFKEDGNSYAFLGAQTVNSSYGAQHHTGVAGSDELWGETGWRYFVCGCNTSFGVDGDLWNPHFYSLDREEPPFSFRHGTDYYGLDDAMRSARIGFSQDSLTLLPDGRLAFSLTQSLDYEDMGIEHYVTDKKREKMAAFNDNVAASYALTLYNDRDGLGFYSYDENLALFFRGVEDIPHVQAQLIPKLNLLLRSEHEEVRELAADVLQSLA